MEIVRGRASEMEIGRDSERGSERKREREIVRWREGVRESDME